MAAAWALRFRPGPEARAWRRGAVRERRTARLLGPLERHGWAILHDLALSGSRANLDHLVIGPGGVFVIDSKQYRGRLQLDASGRLWHGRYPLVHAAQTVSWEADRAAQVLPDPGVVVLPVVAVHGAPVPWGKVVTKGVPVVAAGACQACFVLSQRCWGRNGSPGWPTRLGSASTPPPDPCGPVRWFSTGLLMARRAVLGLEGLVADPAGDRPGSARCWASSSAPNERRILIVGDGGCSWPEGSCA